MCVNCFDDRSVSVTSWSLPCVDVCPGLRVLSQRKKKEKEKKALFHSKLLLNTPHHLNVKKAGVPLSCFYLFLGVRGCAGWVLAMGDCSVISLCFEYIRLRTWVRRLNKNFRGEEEGRGAGECGGVGVRHFSHWWLDAVLWNRWHLYDKYINAELITRNAVTEPPSPHFLPPSLPPPLVFILLSIDADRRRIY